MQALPSALPSAPAAASSAAPAAASSAAPAATITEIVHRPDPGLGRGVWEASPAFFWLVVALMLVVPLAFVVAKRVRTKQSGTK